MATRQTAWCPAAQGRMPRSWCCRFTVTQYARSTECNVGFTSVCSPCTLIVIASDWVIPITTPMTYRSAQQDLPCAVPLQAAHTDRASTALCLALPLLDLLLEPHGRKAPPWDRWPLTMVAKILRRSRACVRPLWDSKASTGEHQSVRIGVQVRFQRCSQKPVLHLIRCDGQLHVVGSAAWHAGNSPGREEHR